MKKTNPHDIYTTETKLKLLQQEHGSEHFKSETLSNFIANEPYQTLLCFVKIFFGEHFFNELLYGRVREAISALYLWLTKYNRTLKTINVNDFRYSKQDEIDSFEATSDMEIIGLCTHIPTDVLAKKIQEAEAELPDDIRTEIIETKQWCENTWKKFGAKYCSFDDWIMSIANMLILYRTEGSKNRDDFIETMRLDSRLWAHGVDCALSERYEDYTRTSVL